MYFANGLADGALQTSDIEPMLLQCWPIVFAASPALRQHWINVKCLLKCGFVAVIVGMYCLQ